MSRKASPYHLNRDEVKKLMKKKGITTSDLSVLLRCDTRTINRYLQKKNPYPVSVDTVKILADEFGVHWESLAINDKIIADGIDSLRKENELLSGRLTIQEDRNAILGILTRHACATAFSVSDMDNPLYDELFWHHIDSLVESVISQNQNYVNANKQGQLYAIIKSAHGDS